jgi:hypothetical protein
VKEATCMLELILEGGEIAAAAEIRYTRSC